jgi:hypothetical protein
MLVETLVEGTVEFFANTCGELCAESFEGRRLCAQRFIGLVLQKGRRSQRHLPVECRGETIERLLNQTNPVVAQAGIGDRKQQAGQRGDEFEARCIEQLVQTLPALDRVAAGNDAARSRQRHSQPQEREQQPGADQHSRHRRLVPRL